VKRERKGSEMVETGNVSKDDAGRWSWTYNFVKQMVRRRAFSVSVAWCEPPQELELESRGVALPMVWGVARCSSRG